jgi:hypothetical protein
MYITLLNRVLKLNFRLLKENARINKTQHNTDLISIMLIYFGTFISLHLVYLMTSIA